MEKDAMEGRGQLQCLGSLARLSVWPPALGQSVAVGAQVPTAMPLLLVSLVSSQGELGQVPSFSICSNGFSWPWRQPHRNLPPDLLFLVPFKS